MELREQMLNFLFKKKKEDTKRDIQINDLYASLRALYPPSDISDDRKIYLKHTIKTYGYLPYPYIKALEELTPAEVLFGLEAKWENEGVFDGEKFSASQTSVLARNGVKNSNWLKKEGHDIKLINLAALGNGNDDRNKTGKFIDWLRQLLILPTGVSERGIFSTTIYLIPFHPREFGCAYLPTSTEVSQILEDSYLKTVLGLDAKGQVQLFITMAQLAGHPVIYDVLPQTGRFSKVVLANPYLARWFDIKEFQVKINNYVELVCKELERKFDKEDVDIIKDIYKNKGSGDLSEDYQKIYNELEDGVHELKKVSSGEMLRKENQVKIQKKVKEIVAKVLDVPPSKHLTEEDITKQIEIVHALMNEGLWSSPGGAWCSAGVPVYEKMSDCGSYPIFKHYDYKNTDVTEFANLDCQTPFYFAFLENGQLNRPVVEFYIDYMSKLQYDYNFDGFRIDHVDHIVDEVSQKNGLPISYRVPAQVLKELNSAMKLKVPYFASLAEYMLGDDLLKEYHQDMDFDILWGNDIIGQSEKTPEKIVEDNQHLTNYNTKDFKIEDLSILKTYNNQDGEFEAIDRYPGQLEKEGALFKWFKYKFLPGGKYAQRPLMYVDGDESFTKTGVENTIGNEISMVRERDYDFFAKFDGLNRLAKSLEIVTEGEAQIIVQDDDGFVSWLVTKEPLKQALLVVANYKAPKEKVLVKTKSGEYTDIIRGEEVTNKTVHLPGDYTVTSEFVFDGNDFAEKEFFNEELLLFFLKLQPGEFKMFLLQK